MTREEQLEVTNRVGVRVQSLLVQLGAVPSQSSITVKLADGNLIISAAAIVAVEQALEALGPWTHSLQ